MRSQKPSAPRDTERVVTKGQTTRSPDDRLIEAHLKLSPTERLQALQSFVDDVIRMRRGRRPPVR